MLLLLLLLLDPWTCWRITMCLTLWPQAATMVVCKTCKTCTASAWMHRLCYFERPTPVVAIWLTSSAGSGSFLSCGKITDPWKITHVLILISSQFIFLSKTHLPDYNQPWTHLWWSPERNPCQLELQLDKQPILDDRSSFDKPAKWKCFKQKKHSSAPLFSLTLWKQLPAARWLLCCQAQGTLPSRRCGAMCTFQKYIEKVNDNYTS